MNKDMDIHALILIPRGNMANGESMDKAFSQLDEDIDRLLNNDEISTRELVKGMIRVQRAMLPFISQVKANTQKINIMWAVFRPALAGGSLMLTLILGFLWAIFTGQVELIFK